MWLERSSLIVNPLLSFLYSMSQGKPTGADQSTSNGGGGGMNGGGGQGGAGNRDGSETGGKSSNGDLIIVHKGKLLWTYRWLSK